MAFYAYLLRCRDGTYYAGHTDDIEHRIAQHQTGALGGYTARRLPVELVWSDSFMSRDEAFAAERKLKGWSRAIGSTDRRGLDFDFTAGARANGPAPRPHRQRGCFDKLSMSGVGSVAVGRKATRRLHVTREIPTE